MRLPIHAAVALAVTALCPEVVAQKSEDVVRWSAKAPAASVKPGGAIAIQLTAQIEPGWKMYALTQVDGGPPPLVVDIAKGQPFTLDKNQIKAPLPGVTRGTGSDPDSFHYDETIALSVPLTAPKPAKAGKHRVPIEVTYQVCSGSICLRPATAVLPVDVRVAR